MLTRLFSNLTLSSSSLLRNSINANIRTSFQPNAAFNLKQTANMSKYISKSRAKRLPLTTKRAGKGFYKGNRSRKEGWLDNRGKFSLDSFIRARRNALPVRSLPSSKGMVY